MNASSLALIVTGVLLNALAQLMLKAGADRIGAVELKIETLAVAARSIAFSAPILIGIACYVASMAVWILALTRVEVSVAYPMLSLGYLITAVAAWMLFGEQVTPLRIAGILIIIAGVYIVAISGRA